MSDPVEEALSRYDPNEGLRSYNGSSFEKADNAAGAGSDPGNEGLKSFISPPSVNTRHLRPDTMLVDPLGAVGRKSRRKPTPFNITLPAQPQGAYDENSDTPEARAELLPYYFESDRAKAQHPFLRNFDRAYRDALIRYTVNPEDLTRAANDAVLLGVDVGTAYKWGPIIGEEIEKRKAIGKVTGESSILDYYNREAALGVDPFTGMTVRDYSEIFYPYTDLREKLDTAVSRDSMTGAGSKDSPLYTYIAAPWEKFGYTAAQYLNYCTGTFTDKLASILDYMSKRIGTGSKDKLLRGWAQKYYENADYWKAKSKEMGPAPVIEFFGSLTGAALPTAGEFLLNWPYAALIGATEAEAHGENEFIGAAKKAIEQGLMGDLLNKLSVLPAIPRMVGTGELFGGYAVHEARESGQTLSGIDSLKFYTTAGVLGFLGGKGKIGTRDWIDDTVRLHNETAGRVADMFSGTTLGKSLDEAVGRYLQANGYAADANSVRQASQELIGKIRAYEKEIPRVNPQLDRPIAFGDFGPVFTQFKSKPYEAIDHLLKVKDGEAVGALYKKGVGDIDLVWGKGGEKGYGLAHIGDKHGEEIVHRIPDIIDRSEILSTPFNRVYLDTPGERAVIRLDWNKKEKNWLLTTYEKNDPYPNAGRTTEGSGSEGSAPAPAPQDKGLSSLQKNDPYPNAGRTTEGPGSEGSAPTPAPQDKGEISILKDAADVNRIIDDISSNVSERIKTALGLPYAPPVEIRSRRQDTAMGTGTSPAAKKVATGESARAPEAKMGEIPATAEDVRAEEVHGELREGGRAAQGKVPSLRPTETGRLLPRDITPGMRLRNSWIGTL